MRELTPQPLTRRAFAAFGEVIDTADMQATPINADRALRYHGLAHPSVKDGQLVLSMVYSQAASLPADLAMMECHPQSSQAFIPLQGQTMLIVVAQADSVPRAADLHAFISQPGQGINYFAGTWHYPLLPIQMDGNFLVVDRDEPDSNCQVVRLDEPVRVSL